MRATIVLVVCLLGTVCCQLVVNASETFTCNTIARFNIRYCGNYFPKPTQSSVQVYHRPEHPFLYIDEGFVPKETDDDDDDTNNALFGEPVSVDRKTITAIVLNKTLFGSSEWTLTMYRTPSAQKLTGRLFLLAQAYEPMNVTLTFNDTGASTYSAADPAVLVEYVEKPKLSKVVIIEPEATEQAVVFTNSDFEFDNSTLYPRVFVTIFEDLRGATTANRWAADFSSPGLDALLVGLMFLLITAICLPCCCLWILATCCFCCSLVGKGGEKRSEGAIAFVKKLARSPQRDDDESHALLRCVNNSVCLASGLAVVGSAVMTFLSLFAIIFNISLISNGLAYLNEDFLDELKVLSANLISEYAFDVSAVLDALADITSFMSQWKVALAEECVGGQVVISVAILAIVGWFTFITVFLDLYVKVKLWIAGANGPFFEMLGNSVSRLLLYLLQAALQQLYVITVDLTTTEDLSDAEGCTGFDTALIDVRTFRTILWIVLILATIYLFTRPWGDQADKASGWKGVVVLALYGLLVNVLITLGIWTKGVVEWVNLEDRSDLKHADLDETDATTTTMDTIGRVTGLFCVFVWRRDSSHVAAPGMMLPPFFVVGAKLAEATNESSLLITDKATRDKLDPWFVRAPVLIINLCVLALELYAAATANATAVVVAAALVVFRDMVVKLITKIWHIRRKQALKRTRSKKRKAEKREEARREKEATALKETKDAKTKDAKAKKDKKNAVNEPPVVDEKNAASEKVDEKPKEAAQKDEEKAEEKAKVATVEPAADAKGGGREEEDAEGDDEVTNGEAAANEENGQGQEDSSSQSDEASVQEQDGADFDPDEFVSTRF